MPEKIKIKIDHKLTINNCHECPFVSPDNEYGYTSCNINDNVNAETNFFEQLPSDKVHDLCPLKDGDYIVGITWPCYNK